MIGVMRHTLKAVPLRLQNPPYNPPFCKFCKLVYNHLGEIHPTTFDESDQIEEGKHNIKTEKEKETIKEKCFGVNLE